MSDPNDTPARIVMPTIGSGNESGAAIPFSDIEKKLLAREQVFVRNKGRKPQAWLIIQLEGANGQAGRTWNVPATSIPFDITAYVHPEALAKSDSFRSYFAKGLLEYVSLEQAAKELRDPERLKGLQKALNDANNTATAREDEPKKMKAALDDPAQQTQNGNNMGFPSNNDVPQFQKQGNVQDLSASVAMKFSNLETRAKFGKTGEVELLSELRGMLGELTKQQLEHVANSAFFPASVRAWAVDRAQYAD